MQRTRFAVIWGGLALAGALAIGSMGSHAVAGSPPEAGASPVAAAPAVKLDLSKAYVIGASVSDGFGLRVTLPPAPAPEAAPGAKTDGTKAPPAPRARSAGLNLADVLAAVVDAPAGLPRANPSSMFFMDARTTGKEQMDAAVKAEPSMVFALDYLFWYVYGVMPEDERLTLLEEGLKNLDRLTCPMVVGDIPDMSAAIGGMLSRPQVPEAATMEKANARIAQWAAGKKSVVVLSLSTLIKSAMSGGKVELGGRTFEGDAARRLIQGDKLHATLTGSIAISIDGLRRLREAGLVDKNSTWSEDAAEIERRLVIRRTPKPKAARENAPAPVPAPAPAPAAPTK